MPSRKLKPHSDHGDILWATVTLIVMMFFMCSTGCVSMPSGPEPAWTPAVYRVKLIEGRCTFYHPGLKHTLDCDEPVIQDFVLIHSSFMPLLVQKFNACKAWK